MLLLIGNYKVEDDMKNIKCGKNALYMCEAGKGKNYHQASWSTFKLMICITTESQDSQ